MIPPDTTPFTPRLPADCALCSGPLAGNRVCCRACLDAAARVEAAHRRGSGPIRPSDVLRERGRG